MKKVIKIVALATLTITAVLGLKTLYKENKITLKNNNMNWNLKYKGIKDAKDFTVDEKGNYYIAYKDKIQFIDSKGKSYDIVNDNNLNIVSIEYNSGKLYYSSNTKVVSFDLENKTQKEIINNLPNFGDYKDSILKIKNNIMYITIGAATNSGVVGNDNTWIKDYPYNHDISPKDITLKGKSFGEEKTGAYVAYKTRNINGQVMPGHFPGNASIISLDLKNQKLENFAWGIRNIKGMDFNSSGKFIAAVGGMEDRGLRAVKGDLDYIYEIKKGSWYGWPDYSGGDPISSPKFKTDTDKKLSFILDNHPSTNPPAPIYQHKALATLGALAIDNNSNIGEKDCIYFYDTRDNIIYGLNKDNILKEEISLNKGSIVRSMKFIDKEMILLDSSEGCLYSIIKNDANKAFKMTKQIGYYSIIVVTMGIAIILWRSSSK